MSERFVAVSVTGYSEQASGRTPAKSWSVLDSAYCYAEVARFYAERGGTASGYAREQKCRVEAARLNAECPA